MVERRCQGRKRHGIMVVELGGETECDWADMTESLTVTWGP